MNYRRILIPGATCFFTINLFDRTKHLLTENIGLLKAAFVKVKRNHPFIIDAIVIMPEHFHLLIVLPDYDTNFSQRMNLIKGEFSRHIKSSENISKSRKRKNERSIWQRRFWDHMIRDERDYEHHINYIHYNPVKHGYVKNPTDWPHSSIHKYIRDDILPTDWAAGIDSIEGNFGE